MINILSQWASVSRLNITKFVSDQTGSILNTSIPDITINSPTLKDL